MCNTQEQLLSFSHILLKQVVLLYWEKMSSMGAWFYRYQCEFGFTIEGRVIVVDDVRVRGTGKSLIHTDSPVSTAEGPPRVDKASC
jgi:hypothetical protein